MADLINMVGFESGGFEETDAVNGSPTISSGTFRNGEYGLQCSTAGDGVELPHVAGGTTASGPGFILWIVSTDVRFTSVASGTFYISEDSFNDTNFHIALNENANIVVIADNGTQYVGTTTILTDQWYDIDIFYEGNTSGTMSVYLDGESEIEIAEENWDVAVSSDRVVLQAPTNNDTFFDNFYVLSGIGLSVSDFKNPGTYVSKAYQNTVEDATDQGDALDQGRWDDMSNTPGVEEATLAAYTVSAAKTGYARHDEGDRLGPFGDVDDATVIGGKWLFRLSRTGGSGATHFFRYGKGDGTTDVVINRNVSLSSSLANFSRIREAGIDRVPEVNDEYFLTGIGKSSGGRDIECSDNWSMILQEPAAAPEPDGAKHRKRMLGLIGRVT